VVFRQPNSGRGGLQNDRPWPPVKPSPLPDAVHSRPYGVPPRGTGLA
jgi:hypothetical protein